MEGTSRKWTVAALLLSMFMAAMEATVVATAMPTVIADLGGLPLYGWVSSAYLLASTITVPIYGKLADLYGRKPVLLFGIALFLLGSVTSGVASSIQALIVYRAIQGLGAGAMQPIALTIIGDIFSVEERGRVQGMFGAVWGIAGAGGPFLGGAIVQFASWHWVFLVNLPFGALAAAILVVAYKEKSTRTERPVIDWLGGLLLAAGSVAILLGATGVYAPLTLPIGVALSIAFVLVEKRARDPLLPLSLVTRRPIAIASLSALLLGATMVATFTYVPLYMQGVLAKSPTDAGTTIAPVLVGWPIAATITSRSIVRLGYRPPIWAGSLTVAVALVGFEVVRARWPSVLAIQATMFGYGFGMGLANTALLLAVQNSVGFSQRGVATASSMFARTMGGALGVGFLGSMLAAAVGSRLSPDLVRQMLGGEGAPGVPLSELTRHVLGDALHPIFLCIVGIALVNVVVVAMYPAHAVAVREKTPVPS